MAESSPEKKESAPRGIRILIRVWGTISALCIGIAGLFVMITLSATCLATGILMLLVLIVFISNCVPLLKDSLPTQYWTVGLILLPLEAPVLCANFPGLVKASDWIEDHLTFWMRAALYTAFAMPPFFLCPETSTFVGGASVLVTAALYGVLAIGKKGSHASQDQHGDIEMRTQLVKNGEANEETGM